jgi:[acyl-carrier-protein] S-malonyltransferase
VSYALLFPGQASQQVGMGADFRRLSDAAAGILDTADRLAELPLSVVMAEGPLERLTDTRYAQPAVVATSLAGLAALRERLGLDPFSAKTEPGTEAPVFCAGHSVGELAAVAAAGALDFETTLQLVVRRSRLTAEVCECTEGVMAAVLGLDEPGVQTLCREASAATGRPLQVANLNAVDQLVVSGHQEALSWLQREGPERGARRIVPLNVGGPFHSAYLQPAAQAFAKVLDHVPLRAPEVPVVLNQTARPTRDPEEIRRELAEQIAAPVRWFDSLRVMAEAGCELFLEVGAGQVLSGLVRRTLPEARAISVYDEASLEHAVAALSEVIG